jgi:histidine triad (HIT) family protein
MSSIFSQIITGEIPAYKVAESIDFLAFLDINPLAEGHVLVIPKKEVDYLFDLEDELYTGLHIFAKIVGTTCTHSPYSDELGKRSKLFSA